jgi:hypothetical protein
MAFMLPWIVFLFVGAFDWGFYAHALISTESAVRVAALYGSNAASGKVSSTAACTLVLDELKIVSNVTNLTSCTGTLSASQPVILSATCPATSSSLDNLNTVQMALTYQTLQLIPIPGLLMGQATIYRTVQLPMKGNTACSIT